MATLSIDRMGPVYTMQIIMNSCIDCFNYIQIVNFFQPVTLRAVGIAVVK